MGRRNLKGVCCTLEQQLLDKINGMDNRFRDGLLTVHAEQQQLRRAATQVYIAWQNLLALQLEVAEPYNRAPKKLHRVRMWFVLEELEVVFAVQRMGQQGACQGELNNE